MRESGFLSVVRSGAPYPIDEREASKSVGLIERICGDACAGDRRAT